MRDARRPALAAGARGLPFYAEQGGECALFEQAFQQLPLLIKGPTGCGKTRFVEHMAARLGRPLITVSLPRRPGRRRPGRPPPDRRRQHRLDDGPLTRAVREGAICYLDEVVEARKDTTVVLHPLADDRRVLPIERTGELLKRRPSSCWWSPTTPATRTCSRASSPARASASSR
jgi:nitric oxide reductase NorQ protein